MLEEFREETRVVNHHRILVCLQESRKVRGDRDLYFTCGFIFPDIMYESKERQVEDRCLMPSPASSLEAGPSHLAPKKRKSVETVGTLRIYDCPDMKKRYYCPLPGSARRAREAYEKNLGRLPTNKALRDWSLVYEVIGSQSNMVARMMSNDPGQDIIEVCKWIDFVTDHRGVSSKQIKFLMYRFICYRDRKKNVIFV